MISEDILEKLEAEKRREIAKHLKEKEQKAELRRLRLLEKKSLKAERAKRRRDRARQRLLRLSENASMEARESLETKMRRAEDKKASLRLKKEDKLELARLRRLRATLKSRAAKAQDMEMVSDADDAVPQQDSEAEGAKKVLTECNDVTTSCSYNKGPATVKV